MPIPPLPFCEFYSHCNWFGEIAQKSFFYDWIMPTYSYWGGICMVVLFYLGAVETKLFTTWNWTVKLCFGLQTTSQFLNSVQNILKIDLVLWFCKFWCPVSKYSSTLLTKFKFDMCWLYGAISLSVFQQVSLKLGNFTDFNPLVMTRDKIFKEL